MLLGHRQHAVANHSKLFRRRKFARHRFELLGFQHFLETGDANHEELVQVAGKYREELKPLQQRHRLISRLFKKASKEFQLA